MIAANNGYLLAFARPILLNSIEEVVSRPDLVTGRFF